jgi:hypothetical protein
LSHPLFTGVFCVWAQQMGEMTIYPCMANVTCVAMVHWKLPGDVGFSVVGSLVALALFGRLHPRAVWTDRLAYGERRGRETRAERAPEAGTLFPARS